MRFKLVEDGQALPQHKPYIESLHEEQNMMMEPRGSRGDWAEGPDVKNLVEKKAAVVFHAGRDELSPATATASHCSRKKKR